ncbi:MAG: 50S ribosomal protein L19, partial [Hyphomicrobiaceae bacterium]
MNIIEELEREQIRAVLTKRGVPEFAPGDTLRVTVKVTEGDSAPAKGRGGAKPAAAKTQSFRLQAYEGV